MRVVWKFPITLDEDQKIAMPKRSRVLCVQMQGVVPCIWAVCESLASYESVTVKVVGTGHEIEAEEAWSYLGTVQQGGGAYIWHVFVGAEFHCDSNREP